MCENCLEKAKEYTNHLDGVQLMKLRRIIQLKIDELHKAVEKSWDVSSGPELEMISKSTLVLRMHDYFENFISKENSKIKSVMITLSNGLVKCYDKDVLKDEFIKSLKGDIHD